MYFALAQILFAIWAVMFAHFQSPVIKDRRDYVPVNSPNQKKIHSRGRLLSSLVAAFFIGLLYGVTLDWLQCAFVALCFIAIYKVLFDGVIGIEVYNDFYYLGTTAKQDDWINKEFPHDRPGEVKVFLSAIVFLLFNILNYLL